MTDKQIMLDGVDVLKEKINSLSCSENCYKYKQTEQKLEKIKEICKNVMPTGIDEETDKFGDILEIIEE